MIIYCIKCREGINLGNSHNNYEGEIECKNCGETFEVKTKDRKLIKIKAKNKD